MRLLRMKPGHGEVVIAEGDVDVPAEEQVLIEAFRVIFFPRAAGGGR